MEGKNRLWGHIISRALNQDRKLKGKTGNGHKQGKLQEPSNDHVEDEYDQ